MATKRNKGPKISTDLSKFDNDVSQLYSSESTLELIRSNENLAIEELLQSIVNTIAGNHWWKDKDGKYLVVNERVAKHLGLDSADEIIGKTDFEMPWCEQAETLIAHDKLVMESENVITDEETVIGYNDKNYTFLVTKAPMYNEKNEVIGTIGTSVDITHQKEIEKELRSEKKKAEAANTAKSEFIANLSHDLRTPLSGIIGLANSINKKSTQKNMQRDAIDISRAGESLLFMLEEIIEYIKGDTHDLPVQHEQFDVPLIFEKLYDLYKPIAKDKKLKLEFKISPSVPTQVIGDPLRLHRIVLNLLSNALKFTKKGTVTLKLSSPRKLRSKKCLLKIDVIDTGIGIPKDKLSYIFGRFNRLKSTYEGVYPGLGLGLSVVKKHIDALDGEVHVKSKVGQGSTFTCIIPFKKPLLDKSELFDSNDQIENEYEKNGNSIDSSLPILLIEDNEIATRLVSDLLDDLQLQVDTASTGNEALKLALSKRYGLILMDAGLPDIDGLTLSETIVSLENSPNKNTPIVIQTAHLDKLQIDKFKSQGVKSILYKPLTIKKLENVLNKGGNHE